MYALIGAREAREHFSDRIGDLPVFVVGFGLLGEQLARALSRLGMPRDRIAIIDTSAEALERARRLGFATSTGTATGKPEERPEKALVYLATPSVGLDASNAHQFAKSTIAISLVSGGAGFDRKSLDAQSGPKTFVNQTRTASKSVVADEQLVLRSPHGDVTSLLLIDNPNLSRDMWVDRFQSTSLGVSGAVQQAWYQSGPDVQPLHHGLDLRLVRLLARHGTFRIRPLEARNGEDPAALVADLQSFKPSTPSDSVQTR
jgi:hypothetical protein